MPLALCVRNYSMQCIVRVTRRKPSWSSTRFFTNHPSSSLPKPLPPLPSIPDADLDESFLKGSGPGGQKINKTSSAVQLKHLPTGIVIKSQATRSRSQNRKVARRLLALKLEEIELGDGSRTRLKEEKERKRKASKAKKARRKYGALQDGRGGIEEANGIVGVDVNENVDEDDEDEDDSDELGGDEEGRNNGGASLGLEKHTDHSIRKAP